MPTNTLSFAYLIKTWRLQRGLSQSQLAQAAHLSRVYVHHLEAGARQNPSARVVQHLAQALLLQEDERQQLFSAFTHLTGRDISYEMIDMPDAASLMHLLVLNHTYPAHALDQLWYVRYWNTAARELFEFPAQQSQTEPLHLLELVFGAHRPHFFSWEKLARRLLNEFLATTRALTHLPAYREIWQRLCTLPDFQRLAAVSVPNQTSSSLLFSLRHSQLGPLTLRTAPMIFTRTKNHCLVSYLPGNQQTLSTYRQCGWQPETLPADPMMLKLFS